MKWVVVFEPPAHHIQPVEFSDRIAAQAFKAEHPLGKFAAVVARKVGAA